MADPKAPAIAAGGAVRASATPKQAEPKSGESEPMKAPEPGAEIERVRAEIDEARRNFQAERELAEEDLRGQRDELAKQRREIEQGRAELAKAAERFAEESARQYVAGKANRALRIDHLHDNVFRVAPGHALATARGILDGGTVVTLEDFGGSRETLDAHYRKGRIVRP